MIEGGKAVAGEIDNLEHDRGIVSQGREEADHKNKRRSKAAILDAGLGRGKTLPR